MNSTHPVFTIGHGSQSFPDLVPLLVAQHVATIVDVRSKPYSRFAPDFAKERLEGLAAMHGFGYRWLGEQLGGLDVDPQDRPGFDEALREVLLLAKDAPVVLLCAEAQPDWCHRATVLAPALERLGATVRHILPDGSVAPTQPHLDFGMEHRD